ncbi:MAG: hypothetical protein WC389_00090 [Lutibacter sp.]|jgi:hypothetical protein
MEWTSKMVKEKMSVEKVSTLLLALEIIANGDPIGIGVDEVKGVCQKALEVFNKDD